MPLDKPPTLLGRTSPMPSIPDKSTVLIGTDFSTASRDAVLWAAENVLMSGDHVLLFHVLNPNTSEIPVKEGAISVPSRGIDPNEVASLEDDRVDVKTKLIHVARDQMNDLMQQVRDKIEGAEQDVTIEGLIEFGDPQTAIVTKAKAIAPKFLIMGTRGCHSSWRGLTMGSVSQYALQHADCPVLISRGRRPGRRGSILHGSDPRLKPSLVG